MPQCRQNGHAAVRVRRTDRRTPRLDPDLPVVIVLDNLRSAFNVGNIIRLAEATGVEKVCTCGYTASPPHPKLAKTARGCDSLVPCQHCEETGSALALLKQTGHTVYGVETVEDARSVWEVSFDFPAAFVLGNEALGISREALALCDEFVELPCFGVKNSINVGNCAAVVLYAALRQWREAGRRNGDGMSQ